MDSEGKVIGPGGKEGRGTIAETTATGQDRRDCHGVKASASAPDWRGSRVGGRSPDSRPEAELPRGSTLDIVLNTISRWTETDSVHQPGERQPITAPPPPQP